MATSAWRPLAVARGGRFTPLVGLKSHPGSQEDESAAHESQRCAVGPRRQTVRAWNEITFTTRPACGLVQKVGAILGCISYFVPGPKRRAVGKRLAMRCRFAATAATAS